MNPLRVKKKTSSFGKSFRRKGAIFGLAALAALAPMKSRAQSNYLHFALVEHVGGAHPRELYTLMEKEKAKGKPFQFMLLEAADLTKADRKQEEAWYNNQIRDGRKFYLDLKEKIGEEKATEWLRAKSSYLFKQEFGTEIFCNAVRENLLMKYAEERKSIKEFEEQEKLSTLEKPIIIEPTAHTTNVLHQIKSRLVAAQRYLDVRDEGLARRIKTAIEEIRKETPRLATNDMKGIVIIGSAHGTVLTRVKEGKRIAVERIPQTLLTDELSTEVQKELSIRNQRLDRGDSINRVFVGIYMTPAYKILLQQGKVKTALALKNLIMNLPEETIREIVQKTQNLTDRDRLESIYTSLHLK